MATAPMPSHSPRASDAAAAANSPRSRRASGVRAVPSAWSQIVRGSESDTVAGSLSSSSSSSSASSPAFVSSAAPSSPASSAVVQEQVSDWSLSKLATTSPFMDVSVADEYPENSDCGSGSSNAAKKPAWNKPSNGVVEVTPVMGAVSWPALSESTKFSPKSASSDSLKGLSDGSLSLSQGTGIVPSSSHKQVSCNNTNPNSTPNHTAPTRQRPMKRGGTSNNTVSANGGFVQPQLPQSLVVEMPIGNSVKPGSAATESSSRDHIHKEVGQRGGSHNGNDHQQHRNSFRRGGNGGPHLRADGSYHHGYGGRRDHDRGNQDWNSHRSYGGRDTYMQPQRGFPRAGFMRAPPHTSTPFIPPPPLPMPVRPPYANHMVYPGDVASPMLYVTSPDPLRAVPIVAPIPPHAIFFPAQDPQLHTKIVNQIDYYFSNDNLIKDTFLRQKMDDQGWVSIKLIAGFKKVKHLTDNIQLILDAVRASTVVEVQGDKVRKRNDWMRWIMPQVPFSSLSSPQSQGRSSHDVLEDQIQSLSLDEKNRQHSPADLFSSRSSSGDLNILLQQTGGEGAGVSNCSSGV